MISYGSHTSIAEMLARERSHQLGEGHTVNAEMPKIIHPSPPVYGKDHGSCAAMPFQTHLFQGEGQLSTTGMSGVVHPPLLVLESQGSDAEMPMRDLSQGKGQTMYAEMPMPNCPSQPVYGSQQHHAEMSYEDCSQGKGHPFHAEMPNNALPSPPVLGRYKNAERPRYCRPILTRGRRKNAAMPSASRLATKEIQYGYKI